MKFEIYDAHNDLFWLSKEQSGVDNYLKKQTPTLKKFAGVYFSFNGQAGSGVQEMGQCFDLLAEHPQVIPTVENAWFLTPKNIGQFVERRPFYVTLCHNADNALCGGAMGEGELTPWGIEVVKTLEQHGIFIDTAHMNKVSFWQFARMTSKPLFNSHTGFSHFCTHPRNIDREQIQAIKDSAGFIGLAIYPAFLSEDQKTDSAHIASIIEWFTSEFGTDTLGWGSDLNGIETFPEDVKGYEDLFLVADQLLKNGMPGSTVEKFFNKNLARFFDTVQKR